MGVPVVHQAPCGVQNSDKQQRSYLNTVHSGRLCCVYVVLRLRAVGRQSGMLLLGSELTGQSSTAVVICGLQHCSSCCVMQLLQCRQLQHHGERKHTVTPPSLMH